MRHMLVTMLIMGALACSAAHAATGTIVNHIPERYALLAITGAAPGEPLSKDLILKAAQEQFAKLGVEQMQFAVWDEGKKQGDGLRAFGELGKADDRELADYVEVTDVDKGKLAEKFLAYQIEPKDLWKAYDDNEVVADEDFKGKPVAFVTVISGVSKDAMNKPYIKVPVDQTGIYGLHVYLSMDDPNIRKIKKGAKVAIRAIPQKFVIKNVMLNGEIVMIMNDESAKKKK